MYCRNCGAKIADDAEFCPVCGRFVTGLDKERGTAGEKKPDSPGSGEHPSRNPEPEDARQESYDYSDTRSTGTPGYSEPLRRTVRAESETNEEAYLYGFAIAALALGIIGVFYFYLFVPSCASLIFGVQVLRDCAMHPGRDRNKSFAIIGIVLGAGSIVFGIFFYVVYGAEFADYIRSYISDYSQSLAAAVAALRTI